MAGNKSDLETQVDEDEVRTFVAENEIVFRNTSALNNSGINELFRDVGKMYLKKYLKEEQQGNEGENVQEEEKNSEEKNESNGKKLQGSNGESNEKKKCC